MATGRVARNSRRFRAGSRPPRKHRTTISLPEDLLRKVERLAAERHQNLSSAVAYLVESGLRNETKAPKDSRDVLEMWKKAYLPLTEEQRLLVDGVIVASTHDEPA
jgi:hypothetical protein